jgi:hypothetical protein
MPIPIVGANGIGMRVIPPRSEVVERNVVVQSTQWTFLGKADVTGEETGRCNLSSASILPDWKRPNGHGKRKRQNSQAFVREGGVPGMDNRDDADAGAEVLGVGRDRERWYSAVTCSPSAPLHSSKSCLGGFTPRFKV